MRLLVILLLLGLVSCKDTSHETPIDNAETENATIEKSMDSLEIYDFQGIEKFLTTTDDKVYVVNFWATWCAPCIKELPYFEQLNKNYENELDVILISLDFPKNYDSKLKPFIQKHQLQSKVMVLNDPDANTWIPKVDESWSGAIPATLIFNKDNRQFYEQAFTYEELETEVKQFLK
uniref:TlpA family protein disulfide reductase n=1 Tax=Gelidibacter sp. TaxID=2018083 RepID=UPI00404939B1